LREWDIPFHELELGDLIGQGRFGRVHRGNWHGDVAIRLLDMDQVGDEKVLESFKHEVATFRKTRHENLVLFMGACMNLPTLALVTSMCKGLTLYKHLHLRKDKFSMNRTIIIAQQISQVRLRFPAVDEQINHVFVCFREWDTCTPVVSSTKI
jgi:kinase suppressor of Ras 2